MLNYIVALSNLPILCPLKLAIMNGDYWTGASIGFVGSMSFISHLIENHKHGMEGIGLSKQVSYLLNRFDVLGCVIFSVLQNNNSYSLQ